jgi:hypothetical protein
VIKVLKMFYNKKVKADIALMPWERVLAKASRPDCDCSKLIGAPTYMLLGNKPRVRKESGLPAVIADWQAMVPRR